MLNQIVLVGRIRKIKKEKEIVKLGLTVPQTFKNKNGEYDNNYIDVIIFKTIAEQVKEYCVVGDLVGIKGRVQKLENDDTMQIIAEKVTFLTTKNTRKEEE